MKEKLEDQADELIPVHIPTVIGILFQYAVDRETILEAERIEERKIFDDHIIEVPEWFMEYPVAILRRAVEIYRQTMTSKNPNLDLHRALSRKTSGTSYEDALEMMSEVAEGIANGSISFYVPGKEIYSVKKADKPKS